MLHASTQLVTQGLDIKGLPREVVDSLQQYEFNRPLVAQLIAIYLRDAPRLLAELRPALSTTALIKPVEILHQLKSLAANFGQNTTSQQAEQLEKLLSENMAATITEDDFSAISTSSQELASKLQLAMELLSNRAGDLTESGCKLSK